MKILFTGIFGNYGAAAACMLKDKGHDIDLYQPILDIHPIIEYRENKSYQSKVNIFNQQPVISIQWNKILSQITFNKIKTNCSNFVEYDIFIISYPSHFLENLGIIMNQQINEIKRPKTILTFTDRSLGCFGFLSKFKIDFKYTLIGFGATPLTAYAIPTKEFHREVYFNKNNVSVGIYPKEKFNHGSEIINLLLGNHYSFNFSSGILELGFNANPAILHSVHELRFIKKIRDESQELMYRNGNFTEEIVEGIMSISNEVNELANNFSISAKSFLEYETETYYNSNYFYKSIFDHRTNNPIFDNIRFPKGLRRSKGIEGIIASFCLWKDLGILAKYKTKVISKLINEWSIAVNIDLRKYGRNLKSLGISNLSLCELIKKF